MYQVVTPNGMGQAVTTPILSTAPAHIAKVLVGPHRLWTRGPGGGVVVRKRGAPGTWHRAKRPTAGTATPGMGCGCAGVQGCGCAGMGQASSLSQVGSDFTTLLSDIFENSDGSLNWTAVAFAGVAGVLIFANWGHTTRRHK